MVFREVSVIEIREVLRAWLAGKGLRKVAGQAGVDRKTARDYVNAALAAGLVRDGGEEQLTDELAACWWRTVRCTGTAWSAPTTVAAARGRRCPSPTGSRAWSARSISPEWV